MQAHVEWKCRRLLSWLRGTDCRLACNPLHIRRQQKTLGSRHMLGKPPFPSQAQVTPVQLQSWQATCTQAA